MSEWVIVQNVMEPFSLRLFVTSLLLVQLTYYFLLGIGLPDRVSNYRNIIFKGSGYVYESRAKFHPDTPKTIHDKPDTISPQSAVSLSGHPHFIYRLMQDIAVWTLNGYGVSPVFTWVNG